MGEKRDPYKSADEMEDGLRRLERLVMGRSARSSCSEQAVESAYHHFRKVDLNSKTKFSYALVRVGRVREEIEQSTSPLCGRIKALMEEEEKAEEDRLERKAQRRKIGELVEMERQKMENRRKEEDEKEKREWSSRKANARRMSDEARREWEEELEERMATHEFQSAGAVCCSGCLDAYLSAVGNTWRGEGDTELREFLVRRVVSECSNSLTYDLLVEMGKKTEEEWEKYGWSKEMAGRVVRQLSSVREGMGMKRGRLTNKSTFQMVMLGF